MTLDRRTRGNREPIGKAVDPLGGVQVAEQLILGDVPQDRDMRRRGA